MKYVIFSLLIAFTSSTHAEDLDPSKLVKEAVEYWRGSSSASEATLTVHRPDWERAMSFESWTKGEKESLVRFTKPAKDAGNATLVKDKEMWSFSPKVNKVIKIPPSMMSQSWMGSDFSHSDLAKQTDIIDQYTHKLLRTEKNDGHTVYVVESIPKPTSAVVWGKEILTIRDDYIILFREFYDQDMKLVKKLTASDIQRSGKRLYARKARMEKVEASDEWTEVDHSKIDFDVDLKDKIFTVSSLQSN